MAAKSSEGFPGWRLAMRRSLLLPPLEGRVFVGRQPIAELRCCITEQLAADRVAAGEQLRGHSHVVHGTQPAVAIAEEQALAGERRGIGADSVPQPLLEDDGVSGAGRQLDGAMRVRRA